MLFCLLALCSSCRSFFKPSVTVMNVLSMYVKVEALPATSQALRPTGSHVLLMARTPTPTALATTTLAATTLVATLVVA